jgi:hypothetical protein
MVDSFEINDLDGKEPTKKARETLRALKTSFWETLL